MAGAIVLYGVGRLLPVEKLEWIIGKWGYVLGLKKKDVKQAENWFNRRGTSSIFFCRFIPLIRSLISIPAGMARMHWGKFLLYTILGTLIWNVVLVCLGTFAGAGWDRINQYMDVFSYVALAAMAIVWIGFIIWLIKKRKGNIRLEKKE